MERIAERDPSDQLLAVRADTDSVLDEFPAEDLSKWGVEKLREISKVITGSIFPCSIVGQVVQKQKQPVRISIHGFYTQLSTRFSRCSNASNYIFLCVCFPIRGSYIPFPCDGVDWPAALEYTTGTMGTLIS